jgi:hypothetical protein
MISVKVKYQNLGLSDQQVDIAVACEELAARLLDSGLPPETVDKFLLAMVKKDSRKLGQCSDLLNPTPEMFDEVKK